MANEDKKIKETVGKIIENKVDRKVLQECIINQDFYYKTGKDRLDYLKEINVKEIKYDILKNALDKIWNNAVLYGYKDVEICGEPGFESQPCISQKDVDILGLTDKIQLEGSKEQRSSCGCPANKKELIKGKPHRCEHNCLYCFWQ